MVLVRKRRGGRRHKKLKAIDPFYSGPRKLLIDKKAFNANQAPKNDEKISNRFKDFLEQKKQAEQKKKKKNVEVKKEDEEYSHLEQKSNESDRNYIRRLTQEAKFAMDCARYESKYDVKLEKTDKNSRELRVKKEKTERNENRLKRLKSRKEEIKLKKEEKILEKNDFQIDRPKFGEIVHEPPTLTLPKKSKIDPTKAGKKDLLLKEKYK